LRKLDRSEGYHTKQSDKEMAFNTGLTRATNTSDHKKRRWKQRLL